MKNLNKTIMLLSAITLLAACSNQEPPNQELASHVDLDRFMGMWYVHGYTPTILDRDAWNPTESYQLLKDGRIQTTYQFRKGSATGKIKAYHPIGTVFDTETNAEWRMRFFGVINAAYYIVYVDPKYKDTIIGHPNKKYAWIMSREKEMSESRYQELMKELERRDYDLGKLQRAPQEW